MSYQAAPVGERRRRRALTKGTCRCAPPGQVASPAVRLDKNSSALTRQTSRAKNAVQRRRRRRRHLRRQLATVRDAAVSCFPHLSCSTFFFAPSFSRSSRYPRETKFHASVARPPRRVPNYAHNYPRKRSCTFKEALLVCWGCSLARNFPGIVRPCLFRRWLSRLGGYCCTASN